MNLIFAGVAAYIVLIYQGHILRHAPLKLCLDLNERTVAILVEGGQSVNVERDAFDHAYEEGVLEEGVLEEVEQADRARFGQRHRRRTAGRATARRVRRRRFEAAVDGSFGAQPEPDWSD